MFFKEKNRCQNITFERFAKEKQTIMHREVVATKNDRKQTDRQTGNTSTTAMASGTAQVRPLASLSLRPHWLLVTCSRHSPTPPGPPPLHRPCRSPRSNRWVV